MELETFGSMDPLVQATSLGFFACWIVKRTPVTNAVITGCMIPRRRP